jgi:hypothetical protein
MNSSEILEYEQQYHNSLSNTSSPNAMSILKWLILVLLFIIAAAALVMATLAYNKEFALSDEDREALDNIESKLGFSGNILLASGFSDEAGFLATNGDIECKNINVSNSITFNPAETLVIPANLQVNGYENSHSDQISTGISFMSTHLTNVAVPVGCGGSYMSQFNTNLFKAIMSGLSGVNTSASTIDGGANWLQLTTPFNNSGIEYSPTLNLYTGIDIAGTDVYTSTSGNDGSWVVGTSFDGVFDLQPIYVGFFERFYVSTTNSNFRVASSTNGSSYSQQASTRSFFDLAFIPNTNRIVTVGASGPQYSDDGVTWTNSSSSTSMFSVCYSGFWKNYLHYQEMETEH